MSGGVDSSVAAALLRRDGFEVIGVFMRLGSPTGVATVEESGDGPPPVSGDPAAAAARPHKQGCCSVLDAADARRVASVLGISFYVVNFQDDFGKVIDYFVDEYNRGRTPNPCVRCNDWLKFGRLAAYAQAVGADFIASGHYARIGADPTNGQPALLRGVDTSKDQSYVLFGMSRQTLAHTMLPIGAMRKDAVRAIAQEMGLPVFNKPDSQEICFVPDQDYAALVARRAPDSIRPGPLVGTDGTEIGEHDGHQHFTIGQRKGIRIAMGRPMYVVDIDADSNRVVLGDRDELLCDGLVASQINLHTDRLAGGSAIPCQVKIRYNHSPQPAMARLIGQTLEVRFEQPQSAVTPGQAAVIYDGDVLLGGGWIDRGFRDRSTQLMSRGNGEKGSSPCSATS